MSRIANVFKEKKPVIAYITAGDPNLKATHKLFAKLAIPLAKVEQSSDNVDRLPQSFGAAEWLIIGMGRTGVASYESLKNQQQSVIGLDADPTVVDSLFASGYNVVYADVGDNALWATLPLDNFKGIILALPSFENRINAIGQLRQREFSGTIGTICYLVEDEQQLLRQGASFVIHPLVEAGNQLAQQMLVKAALD